MKVALLGDVCFNGRFSPDAEGIDERIKEVAEYLHDYDVVIANLETPLCGGLKKNGYKSVHISSIEKSVKLLSKLNVTAVCLANNHIMDYGDEGVRQTITCLDSVGIDYFGVNGRAYSVGNIMVHGYCAFDTTPNFLWPWNKFRVDLADFTKVLRAVRGYRDSGYINIVSMHAGLENVDYPSGSLIRFVRLMLKESRVIFHGHHPHVIQGVEQIDGSLAAYSMGNFCFDDLYSDDGKIVVRQLEVNKQSFILGLEIDQSGIVSYECVGLSFLGKRLVLNSRSAKERLDRLSHELKIKSRKDIDVERKVQLAEVSRRRLKTRNSLWYLRRLTLRSVALVGQKLIYRYFQRRNFRRFEAFIKE